MARTLIIVRTFTRTTVAFILLLAWACPAPAAIGTNPGSGRPADYSGSGDWIGTAGPDRLINFAGYTVYGNIIGNNNSTAGSQGGGNMIYNYGSVDNYIIGSQNSGVGSQGGGNKIYNYGDALAIAGSLNVVDGSTGGGNTVNNHGITYDLNGSANQGYGASGGGNLVINSGETVLLAGSSNYGESSYGYGNTIINSGVVVWILSGSRNYWEYSHGGKNTIYNYGEAEYIDGSTNEGDYSYGGGNTIINVGKVLVEIDGSYNYGEDSHGGGNYIYNHGDVGNICGSYNEGNYSYGGGNYIYNYGTVQGHLWGTDNYGGGTHGGGNTIYNYGTVKGNLFGSTGDSDGQGNTIYNYGHVGGVIYAGDADDTVVIGGGSSVRSLVDGGAGTDTLGLSQMGTVYAADILGTGQYINFENLGIYAGRTTLAGEWNLGTWDFYLANGGVGILDYGAVLTTPHVYVNSGGVLGGNGLIIGDVFNRGVVAPGASVGVLTINGNFFNYGGALLVELGPGSSDLLRVNGIATLDGGYLRTALSPDIYLGGESWTVFTADQIIGSFDGLISGLNSATLSLSMSQSGNSVGVSLSRKPYVDFAHDPVQTVMGSTLDTILPLARTRRGDLADLIIVMDFSYSAAEVSRSLSTLSPRIYPAFAFAQLESVTLTADAVDARLDQARSGEAVSADTATTGAGVSVWARALGAKTSLDGSQGWPGHDQTWGGIVSGADYAPGASARLGLAVGYTVSDMSWDESGFFGDMKSLHLMGYGGGAWNGFHAQACAGLAWHEADARRNLDLPYYNVQAQGEPNAMSYLAGLKGGYDFQVNGWRMGPAAGLRYTHLEQDGFSETRAGGLGLEIDSNDADSLISSLGFNAITSWQVNSAVLRPSLGLAWQHEFNDDAFGVTAWFPDYADVPMSFDGQERPADRIVLDLGLSARLAQRLDGTVEFSQSWGDGYLASALSLSMQYNF